MARTEARIKTEIWHNDTFRARSREAQWTYFVALSQPDLSFCGVVSYTPKRWSLLAPKTSVTAVRRAVLELQSNGFVLADEDTEELWVRTFMRHDGVLASPNLTIAMSREFVHIHSAAIRTRLLEGLGEPFLQGLPEGVAKGLHERFVQAFVERFPKGSRARSAEPPPPPPPPPPSPVGGTNGSPNGSSLHTANDDRSDEISPLGDALHAGLQARGARVSAAQCEGTVREILTWAAPEVVEQELGKLAGMDRTLASPKYFRAMCETTMRNAGQQVPPP